MTTVDQISMLVGLSAALVVMGVALVSNRRLTVHDLGSMAAAFLASTAPIVAWAACWRHVFSGPTAALEPSDARLLVLGALMVTGVSVVGLAKLIQSARRPDPPSRPQSQQRREPLVPPAPSMPEAETSRDDSRAAGKSNGM